MRLVMVAVYYLLSQQCWLENLGRLPEGGVGHADLSRPLHTAAACLL